MNSHEFARVASTTPFDPHHHAPDPQYNSANVGSLLQKSILNEVSETETKTRIELATCCRLFEPSSRNENIYHHLSAKVEEPEGIECFLIHPLGLKYGKVTASSLIKVDADGSIKHKGSTGGLFSINKASFVSHSATHRVRPELRSVLHCHEPSAAGVSSVKHASLELTQNSHQIGPVRYHIYQRVVLNLGEQKRLFEDIGDKNVLILRNHSVLAAGKSVSEAWYLMYQLLKVAAIQFHTSTYPIRDTKNLRILPCKTVQKTLNVMTHKGSSGVPFGVKELSAYMR